MRITRILTRDHHQTRTQRELHVDFVLELLHQRFHAVPDDAERDVVGQRVVDVYGQRETYFNDLREP